MTYIVTHGTGHGPQPIDVGNPQSFDLDSALAHACRLLSEGLPNVAIQDGGGRSISGQDLLACCKGEKKLTADLLAT
jgi:hypothetical protein